NDHIFVTAAQDDKNLVYCLDRKGKLLWEATIGNCRKVRHKKGSSCNPSPTTDGKYVFVYFKSGDFACLDFQGKVLWRKNLQEDFGKDTLWFDLGTSPVLTRNLVVIACIHSGPSYLAGFDKATGKTVWKQDRNLNAPEEAAQTYASPIVMTENGKETIIALGADHVTAHNAVTGKEIWRVGDLNPKSNRLFRSIASPVANNNMVIAPYARGKTLTAIKSGGTGDVTASHVRWTKSGVSADVPTPIAYQGKVYVCTDRGKVICLDIETGKEAWSHQLPKGRGAFSASPILADGRFYLVREDGTTFVLQGKGDVKLLATNKLDEFITATPVFADGQILLRTFDHLYCIGQRTAR
ncbi:MAG TPA: hypothetical protein EYN70_09570, partial [Planctomycetaceae bacterium]|nr:hypothetical protein [Planctomycetaceae bacterium]